MDDVNGLVNLVDDAERFRNLKPAETRTKKSKYAK